MGRFRFSINRVKELGSPIKTCAGTIAVHANRLIVLHKGSVAFQGTPEEVFSHTRELDTIGIGVPQITRITRSLMEQGLPLSTPAITVHQAVVEILSIFGRDVRDNEARCEEIP